MDVFNNAVLDRKKSLHLHNFEKSVLRSLTKHVDKKKETGHRTIIGRINTLFSTFRNIYAPI